MSLRETLRVLLPIGLAWALQAVYLALPFDLMPDVVPLLGWVDDALLFGGALAVTALGVRTLTAEPLPALVDHRMDSSGYAPVTRDELEAW